MKRRKSIKEENKMIIEAKVQKAAAAYDRMLSMNEEEHANEFMQMQHVDDHIKRFKGKIKLNEMLSERKERKSSYSENIMNAARRAAAVYSASERNREFNKKRMAKINALEQESDAREQATATRAKKQQVALGKLVPKNTNLTWKDYENKVNRGLTGVEAIQQMASQVNLSEEAPANSMGTAGISGLDTAVNVGIAGRDTLLAPGPLRRPPPKTFGGKAVFTVPSSDYYKATLGKRKNQHWRSMVAGPLGEEIRQYALDNRDAPIILEDETTGAMMYLRYGKR